MSMFFKIKSWVLRRYWEKKRYGILIVDSKTIRYLNFKKLGKNTKAIDTLVIQPDNISIGDNVGLNFHTLINGDGGVDIGNDVIV
jgi:acetyltransferase-like isoleucine patch superfamily enzyme